MATLALAGESTTGQDLITGALRNLNVLASGETPQGTDGTDALQVLNDMLEAWALEKLMIFSSTEFKFLWNPGQYQYTIGNPLSGTFTGNVSSGSTVISGVSVPANLKVGAYLIDGDAVGGQNLIPSFSPPTNWQGTGAPVGGTKATTVTAISGSNVTMSANALGSFTSDTIGYSIPGDIAFDDTTGQPIPLPVRITNAFTRITVSAGNPQLQGLDYQIRIIPRDKYTALGLKGINGPWPTDLFYDRTYPLGNLYVYPNPSMGGECHLWCDTLLTYFPDLATAINLPQGYARAIKTNLAVELAAEYGKAVQPSLAVRARESKKLIQSLNSIPEVQAFFDQHMFAAGERTPVGFFTAASTHSHITAYKIAYNVLVINERRNGYG